MKAWEVIADHTKLARGTLARNEFGQAVYPAAPDACRWCVLGAIEKAYGIMSEESENARHKLRAFLEDAVGVEYFPGIAPWSDKTTYDEIHNVLMSLDI